MTTNNKRTVIITKEDRIRNLPEHLIDSILERMPIQDVVRTSILSKKWRYKWTTTRALVFGEQLSKKLALYGMFGRHGFIRVVNQVLRLHMGPIFKFHIYIPNTWYASFQEIDRWILFLSTKGIKDFCLFNSKQHYRLPSYVFSCHELRMLKLKRCIFKPPLQFEGFLNLESLVLESIDFRANLGGNVMINLPQLKKLFMHKCTNEYNFKIKAIKLQTLVAKTTAEMLLRLLHSPCLNIVGISIKKPMEDFIQVESLNLALMFRKMPEIQKLYMDGHFLKCLIAEKPKLFSHPVNSLKHLQLQNFELGDLDHLQDALDLLRNSPNLETLCIMHVEKESLFMHYDVEQTSNLLESVDCLDQTLSRLQTVDLLSIQGSKPQLLFIKLLLAHSPSLEKFTIQPNRNLDVTERLTIAKDVMRFARASPNAEVFYLDPKP